MWSKLLKKKTNGLKCNEHNFTSKKRKKTYKLIRSTRSIYHCCGEVELLVAKMFIDSNNRPTKD